MTQPPQPTPVRRRRWFRPLAVCVSLAVIGYFLQKPFKRDLLKLQEQGFSLRSLQYHWLALCLSCLLVVRYITALNCKIILDAFGKIVPRKKVISIILSASLGRYIPGKVLAASAVVMFVRIGIDWSTALAALGLSVAMMILMSMLFSLPVLFFEPISRHFHYPISATIAGLLLFVVFLHPASFVKIANFALKKIKRPPLPSKIHFPTLLKSFAISSLKILLFGLALYSAGRSAHPIPFHQIIPVTGMAALASFLGFVAFFLPAGIGVHESVYYLLFSPLIPIPLVPIILYRIINISADALMGAFGLLTLDLTPPTTPPP